MNYLDTGVIISAIYVRDLRQAKCEALFAEGITSTHALAETFATLTGQYRVKNDVAIESILSVTEALRIEAITTADYIETIKSAKSRGIMGGLIYDALHAAVARRLKVARLYTFNLSNLQHVAADLNVVEP